MRAAWALVLVLACAVSAGGAGGAGGPALPVPAAGGARFQAEATVLLGAADARGAELGYRLRAALAVRALPLAVDPPPAPQSDVLLHFTLESPQLMLRGKQPGADFLPRPSLWDDHPSSEFLARWSAGRITETYLDSKDPPDVLNFKKALISLFQFQVEEGERNETDISGECEVQYEVVSPQIVRKFKHRCMWEGEWDVDEEAQREEEEDDERDEEPPARTERRRATRLDLEGAQLAGAAADDLLLLRAPAAAGPALKARAHTALRRQPAPASPAPPAAPAPAPLAATLAQFPALGAHALPLRAADHVPDDTQEETLEEAVREHRAALEEDAAGSPEAAGAVLALLPAVRRAAAPQLAALLAHPDTGDIMAGLARVLGLSGAWGAHSAAREAFQLAGAGAGAGAGAEGAPPAVALALAREYLAALALAPRAQPAVLTDVLALAARGGALAPDALLAVAAAARRHNLLQTEVKDYVLKSLAKCKDESCRETRLLALGQLRRGDVGALLLGAAERGGRAGLAALGALGVGPRPQRRAARRRLAALALGLAAPALGLAAPAALELRAAALALLLQDGPAAAAHPLAAALRRAGPRELRRVCWQALLAQDPPPPPDLLPALDPRPRDWCKRAYDGTSMVLERVLGALRLRSVQLAERGVLRRGVVDLRLAGRPLLTVEIWARGLESLAPAAPVPPPAAREPEDEPGAAPETDDVAAGIALSVAGVRRPDLLLFESQTELLGHVWAGTGSTATGVLRALVPRAAVAARALSAGLLVHCSAETALALKLDAQAVVSLWGRSAQAGLGLRGAGVARRALRVRTAWGGAEARAQLQAAPALALSAALDFYGAPQLCVHAQQPDYVISHNVTLESSQGARAWRVRRERATSLRTAGRTLALGAANDAACAALAQRDHD